jgi:hypothetical protein
VPCCRKAFCLLVSLCDRGNGLFGNVHLHGCHVAHLKAHANAFAERWVRSIKDECLSKLILFGEASLCMNSLASGQTPRPVVRNYCVLR